jgi:hypothetical protein
MGSTSRHWAHREPAPHGEDLVTTVEVSRISLNDDRSCGVGGKRDIGVLEGVATARRADQASPMS